MSVPNPFPPIGPQPSNIQDTWVLFTAKPEISGQYLDGRFAYNVTVPLPGVTLEETYLGVMSSSLAQEEMQKRKQRFEDHQTFSLKTPIKWWNVGYWVDPVTLELTAYYQHQFPIYTPTQLQWSNWPDTPENFSPSD